MDITYLGHSCFKIKGREATVVIDPFSSEMTGLRFPKAEADIVAVTHQHKDHNFIAGVEGGPFVINAPGEYEIKGVSVFGHESKHDNKNGKNTIYLIEMDGLSVCHLGDLGEMPPPKVLEEISTADILMIPVGGRVTIGPKEAAEIIKQIEPFIVIPMHFKTADHNKEIFGDLFGVEEFISEMGVSNPEKLDKLLVNQEKLPEETKVILLEKKN